MAGPVCHLMGYAAVGDRSACAALKKVISDAAFGAGTIAPRKAEVPSVPEPVGGRR